MRVLRQLQRLLTDNRSKSLDIQVNIEETVSVLFGLEVWVFASLQVMKGMLMENSFVTSCVWCGVAFLHIPAHRDHPFRLNVTACSGRS